MARFKNGWLKLHRDILDQEFSSDLEKVGFITKLLLMANYLEGGRVSRKGVPVSLAPGSVVLGLRDFGKTHGISKNKVARLLKYFEKRDTIRVTSSSEGTIITFCNWKDYQADTSEQTQESGHEVGQERDTSGTVIKKVRKKERKHVGIRMTYPQEFDQLWIEYGRKGDKKAAYEEYGKQNLSQTEIEGLKLAIKNVASITELRWRKDFENFLRTDWREKLNVVYLNGSSKLRKIETEEDFKREGL